VLTVFLVLLVALGFVPGVRRGFEEAVSVVRNNSLARGIDGRVRFWGKVVDQNKAPLEGVNITVALTTLRMVKAESGYREYELLTTKSAADGTFMFDGGTGMTLDIDALGKEGYVLPSAYQAGTRWPGAKYRYRYVYIGNPEKVFTPNRSRPEVFHLWKLVHPEPLEIGGDTSGLNGPELMVGAAPQAFRSVSMMVSAIATSQGPRWEVTVEALEPDGGVVMANPSDVFMFEAPASGYAHSIKFSYGHDGADLARGDPGAPLRFFVRSHQGRWHEAEDYAFFAPNHYGKVLTQMRYWLNPSGSRNLEHDSAHPLPAPGLQDK